MGQPNQDFDIAFFSFNNHQRWLVPGLKHIIQHVPNYNEIILVWDDFVRNRPIDFDQIRREIDHPIRVIKHSELCDWPESIGQWGWIKQQLVKLLCWQYSSCEYTWICDGDILVTGDPELFMDNKPVLRTDGTPIQHHRAYCKFMKKYFQMENLYPTILCNGGGSCLMDNQIVKEMWETCQKLNSKSLTQCVQIEVEKILEQYLSGQNIGDPPFSEFETYANYCLTHHAERFVVAPHNWNYDSNQIGKGMPIHIVERLMAYE